MSKLFSEFKLNGIRVCHTIPPNVMKEACEDVEAEDYMLIRGMICYIKFSAVFIVLCVYFWVVGEKNITKLLIEEL